MNLRSNHIVYGVAFGLGAIFMANLCVAQPTACRRTSGPGTVALLELYSSEGCNSCPPADAFVRDLVARGPGPEQVIPVVLHVDYWDYIGWKDRFASPEYTARQYWLSEKKSGRRSAYTPEFFFAGKEWRDWGGPELAGMLKAINARPAQAVIALDIVDADTVTVDAQLSSPSAGAGLQASDIQLFVALLQDGLSNSVRAGENRGVTLHHDAVVRRWAGPFAARAAVTFQKPIEPVEPRGDKFGAKFRVVAFAQNVRTGEVVQAMSVALPCP